MAKHFWPHTMPMGANQIERKEQQQQQQQQKEEHALPAFAKSTIDAFRYELLAIAIGTAGKKKKIQKAKQ